jgi:hypothetical protein
MQAPLYVAPPPPVQLPDLPPVSSEVPDLLRQLIDAQREQVALLRAQMAAQDQTAKWRAFLARWAGEFPDIGAACKQALPALERAYLGLIKDLTARLRGDDPDDLTDEFVLTEFLDRYGMRLGQLATIMSQLAPLADAAPPSDTPTA